MSDGSTQAVRDAEAQAAHAAASQNIATSLLPAVEANPAVIFEAPEKLPALLAEMRAEIAAHVPDMTTEKTRAATRALAMKVRRSKTAIVAAGKSLTEDARAYIKNIGNLSKTIEDEFDALAVAVRKPLTDWEEAEKLREQQCNELFAGIAEAMLNINGTAAEWAARIEACNAFVVDEAVIGERVAEWAATWAGYQNFLRAHHAAAVAREETERQLAELQRQAAEREEAARVAAEAAAAEAARVAAEQARELAELRAERQARLDAEAAAQAERDREARAAAEAQEAERAAAEEAARAAQAEIDRANAAAAQAVRDAEIAQEAARRAAAETEARLNAERAEAERQAEAERVASEKAAQRRARSKRHRDGVTKSVTDALVAKCLLSHGDALSVVKAVSEGLIERMTIDYSAPAE